MVTHLIIISLCLSYRDAVFTEQHKPGFMSTTSSNVSISTTRPAVAPAPIVPLVSSALFDPANFREVSSQKPQLGSGNWGESTLYIIIRLLNKHIFFFFFLVFSSA